MSIAPSLGGYHRATVMTVAAQDGNLRHVGEGINTDTPRRTNSAASGQQQEGQVGSVYEPL